MAAQDNSNDIVARTQVLIDDVKRQLAQSDEFYRSQGLDPLKVHIVLTAQSTPQIEAKARAAFDADMQAVDQEAREEQARLAFSTGASGGAKRPRMMI